MRVVSLKKTRAYQILNQKKLYYTIATPLLPPTVSNLHLEPYRHQTNRCSILENTALVEMLIVFPMGAEGT